jgi:hypothetical protein
MTRRVGRRKRTMTMQLTNFSPPRSWGARGIDGPIRAIVNGTVEPLEGEAGSRVTIELDFEGHGLASCSCHSWCAARRSGSCHGTYGACGNSSRAAPSPNPFRRRLDRRYPSWFIEQGACRV